MNSSWIDLHCHSHFSDGFLSPTELLKRAASNGVEVLALTDHDSISGLEEARQASFDTGISLINGCEFSCRWNGLGVHILGLNFDLANENLNRFLVQQNLLRWDRARLINEKLHRKGLTGVLENVDLNSRQVPPSRPDLAAAMVRLGYVKDTAEAFKKYLGTGKVAEVPQVWPLIDTVVQVINEAGGGAVIAHPTRYKLSGTKLRSFMMEFKGLGGEAIEVVYSGQKQGEIGMLTDYAARAGLLASVGSDFHTPAYPWADLGRITSLPERASPIWLQWGYPNSRQIN
ncbi:MAG: PHP domain-containing protein [Hahellaceae bacterium]|nr:PHP domain-containing protein [Hahellaceae bacterium]